jgi:sulfate adenylyltransferase subunit 2
MHPYSHSPKIQKNPGVSKALNSEIFPQRQQSLPEQVFSNLNVLESQASHILLETAATLGPTALMFSAGKDSACIAHLAKKLFLRSDGIISIPFSFFHYDSGDNFTEVLKFRDRVACDLNVHLKVFQVHQAYQTSQIKTAPDTNGSVHALVELINYSQRLHKMQGLIGGGRRDEDPVRSKERIFSLRDVDGKWHPHNQRPEVWDTYNTQILPGQHMRVFPISNWTERNVWEYIVQENIDLPSIYYAHEREVFKRNGGYLAYFNGIELGPEEKVELKRVRCRSVGDRKTTGFFESSARTSEQVLTEVIASEYSERAGRSEDSDKSTAMESRKEKGWF